MVVLFYAQANFASATVASKKMTNDLSIFAKKIQN